MNRFHHADDSTLMAHAAGALPEGLSLVLTAHLETCHRCRERVADAEQLGGSMLSELIPDDVSVDSLDRIWGRIDKSECLEKQNPPVDNVAGLPAVLAKYFPGGLDSIHWRMVAPGIRQFIINQVSSERGTVRLFSISPGTTIPHHSHGGTELTLVLRGSFSDEIGRFGPGDLADLDDSVSHQPVADTNEPCICLIATDERLRFTGMFSRLFQPLVGL
ncbi:MAG TPA: ChrR family anti-sigma-E factor [Gammaproteobacteria bacterium]|jgi:putative transcriptional regulator|nr:ChrR family anti-sigma-E factor [Gammaproteobacteria bacterium]